MASSSGSLPPAKPEEGDYIINWHLQYTSAMTLSGATCIQQTLDLMKAELAKIKVDYEFVKMLPGPHKNLLRLKATDKDMLNILEKLREANDLLRGVASRASQRII